MPQCPICSMKADEFGLGPNGRPNATCPGCKSLERHRLIWLYLSWAKWPLRKPRVLHIAPEPCLAEAIARWKPERYETLDDKMSGVAVQADVENLPFSDKSFDLVVCVHVLCEVKNDRRALGEIWRVLDWGGEAIVQSAIYEDLPETIETGTEDLSQRAALYGMAQRWRRYGHDYRERVLAAGFPSLLHWRWAFDCDIEKRYALTKGECVYVARKGVAGDYPHSGRP